MPTIVAVAAVAVFINGYQLMLPTAAIQRDGTVLVPVKGVFDRLGATIDWNAETRRVEVKGPDIEFVLTIGSTEAVVNGTPVLLATAPELIDGNTLIPLRLVATALGADIAWDQERRRVYLEVGPRGPALEATVTSIVNQPGEWVGKRVRVTGEYRGWEPSPFGQATRNGQPVSRNDWVLRDATGEIYCRGDIAVEAPFDLAPYSNKGRRIVVEGLGKLSRQGFAFVEPRSIAVVPQPDGLTCTVETGRRSYVDGEAIRMRLTIENPFTEPVTLQCEPGTMHDIVLRNREGLEVWRLSEASPPAQAPGTVELAAGEAFEIEEVWQPGAAHTPPLPPGRYAVEAEFGGVLEAYPHAIAIWSQDD